MEENLDRGCIVEVFTPFNNKPIKAVVIHVDSYVNDYELSNKMHYEVMLYAQNTLFYATYTYEEIWYDTEDGEGYLDKNASPLTFKSIIVTDVIMPKVDKQLKEYIQTTKER